MLDAARSLGVDIDSVCGGRGICGRCQVTQGLGEFPKHGIVSEPDHLSAFAALETTYRDEKGLAADRRLSCTAQVCGDVLIDVPPESQVHRQVVRKGLDVRTFIVDPVVRLHYVEVTPPELASPTGDLARLFEALEREWQLTDLEADLQVVRDLQPALEKGKYGVTVAVHHGRQVIAVWPGLHETAYGVAIDIGSTTIAGHLANLADGAVLASNGVMNPQIRFGEDLMSRVSYAMMHPEGAGEMTARRPQGARRADRLARDAGRHQARRDPRARAGRQPDHASPPPRHRPDAARRRAVRAGHGPGGQHDRGGARPARPSGRPRLRPAVHRRSRRRRHGRGDPRRAAAPGRADDARRRRRHERRDRPRRQASAAGRVEPDRPGLRGRPDLAAASAPRRAPSSASGSTARRSSRASGSSASTPGRTSRRSRPASPSTGITGICGSGIIEVIAEMFLAGIVTEDGVIDGDLAARTPRIVPDGRTFSYVLHEGDGSGGGPAHRDHPERRAGDPARQGRALRRRPAADGPARDRRASTRSGWPAPSAARSTRPTR